MKHETVFVGLSGGVDSSVAALRLKKAGHKVVGVFIKVWQPDFLDCNWEAERIDAMRVAAHLDIPFRTFDAVSVYKREVADYMINEYKAGRTPNPDVMCNQHVKFGAFLEYALTNGADKVATGHYAQIETDGGRQKLLRGADAGKDQSYFLWSLTEDQLAKIYFPVGSSEKSAVREEARKAGIPTFKKPDSQGICFLGEVDMKSFLSHYIDLSKGAVLDTNGDVIGVHDGALLYTFGQRHGFKITVKTSGDSPQYVISKNLNANTITVSDTLPTIRKGSVSLSSYINRSGKRSGEYLAQFRYRQKPFSVALHDDATEKIKLEIKDESVQLPSVGQSCVLYDETECIGGGIIDSIC